MKWSKLKKRIEENFAESIKGRIEIFTTAYRHQDNLSRSWVVVDKEQKVSLTDHDSFWLQDAGFHELTPTDCKTHPSIDESERTGSALYEPGEFSSYDFKIMAFEFLNTAAQDAIKSEHPILRFLGVLDKKVGKERVKQMCSDPHPLVAFFAKFRLKAEYATKHTGT